MMPMRHIFITNPAAGKKDQTLSAAGHIGRLCKEMGLEYEIFVTEYPRHACEIVDRERAEHPDKVLRFYACGGDGTFNETVAGLMTIERRSPTMMHMDVRTMAGLKYLNFILFTYHSYFLSQDELS